MKISEACKNCYAEMSPPVRTARKNGLELWGPAKTTERRRTSVKNWNLPLKWNKEAEASGVRARVFSASLSDVFEEHPMLDPWRKDLWELIEKTPWLDWLLLTKRPENILKMIPTEWIANPRPNVWFGCTVESQKSADERLPHLVQVPGVVHFVSMEPLLDAVNLEPYLYGPTLCKDCGSTHSHYNTNPSDLPIMKKADGTDVTCLLGEPMTGEPGAVQCSKCNSLNVTELPTVSWVILGGESGPEPRVFDLTWARDLMRQCKAAEVPVFMKQLGAVCHDSPGVPWVCTMDPTHGGEMEEWPEDIRVREFPVGSPLPIKG